MKINIYSRALSWLFASALAATCSLSNAQVPDVKSPVQVAMRDVAAMAGNWSGSGWVMTPQQVSETTTVTQSVVFKLDETALLIQARGLSKVGQESFDALAVLHHDPFQRAYRLNYHLSSGLNMAGSFQVMEANSQFRWSFGVPTGEFRYTIRISEEGTLWNEIGEFSPDGTQWFQIMEATLRKQ